MDDITIILIVTVVAIAATLSIRMLVGARTAERQAKISAEAEISRSKDALTALKTRSEDALATLKTREEIAKHERFSDLSKERRSYGNRYGTFIEVPQWGKWVSEVAASFNIPVDVLDVLYEDAMPPEVARLLENPLMVGFLKGKLQTMMNPDQTTLPDEDGSLEI